jgi:hypothetical protein
VVSRLRVAEDDQFFVVSGFARYFRMPAQRLFEDPANLANVARYSDKKLQRPDSISAAELG